jgi:hypothetical protein
MVWLGQLDEIERLDMRDDRHIENLRAVGL